MPDWVDEEDDGKEPPPQTPDALLDSWLLRHFPGRFLDEVSEQMDIFRFLRALQAQSIESLEETRKKWVQQKLKAADITDEQWKTIRQHDKVLADLMKDD